MSYPTIEQMAMRRRLLEDERAREVEAEAKRKRQREEAEYAARFLLDVARVRSREL